MLHRGDRVVATVAAGRTGLVDAGEEARVAAEPRNPQFVSLIRCGSKTTERWAAGFWRKKPTDRTKGEHGG